MANRSRGSVQLPPEQMNALLQMASRQLGQDPQQLRRQLENGQLGKVLGGLNPQQTAQINALLKSPQQVEQLLRSPQVRDMINRLMK